MPVGIHYLEGRGAEERESLGGPRRQRQRRERAPCAGVQRRHAVGRRLSETPEQDTEKQQGLRQAEPSLMHYCLTLGEARGGRLSGRAGSGEEALCAEGHVTAETLLVERDFEGVVVAFSAEEGQDVVGAGVAAKVEQE